MRTLIISLIVLILVKLFYKELLIYTFNPLAAQAMGLPVGWIHSGLTAAITLTIIVSMQSVGVVLVVALLVGPAITAYLLVEQLHLMMGIGAIFGVISGVSGIYLSYYWNIPSGASIVLVVCGFFALALFLSPSQGILTRPGTANRSRKLFQQLKQLRRSA